jgi:hypothetical protein
MALTRSWIHSRRHHCSRRFSRTSLNGARRTFADYAQRTTCNARHATHESLGMAGPSGFRQPRNPRLSTRTTYAEWCTFVAK